MQIGDPRRQLAILLRRRRCILVLALAAGRIVERPVFDFALPALHHKATNFVEAARIACEVERKVDLRLGHPQFRSNSTKAQIHVGLGK